MIYQVDYVEIARKRLLANKRINNFFNRYPIQVKQSENVGRNVVDNFETALQRDKKDKGFIIALSFGKGAYEEVARIKKEGLFIELLEVDKLLGFSEEKVSDKMFEFY